jgi:hypothetical protein
MDWLPFCSPGPTYPARRPAMDVQLPPSGISAFMVSHLPDFFDRFGISYTIDGSQFEYYVYEKKTGLDISCSLTLSFDAAAGQINVMTFYPGLCLQQTPRYLSAVCFFVVMHHFGNFHHLGPGCEILINTRKGVFDTFYAQLQDFDFHILASGEEDRVDIQSCLLPLAMDTSMVGQRALVDEDGE